MLNIEWNLKDALEVAREEGYEEGFEIGYEEGIKIGREERRKKLIKAFSNVLSPEQIAIELDISVDEVNLALSD